MTGLLIEPCFIIYRVASYIRWSHSPGEPYERVLQIGTWLSTVGLDMSFLLVLGLILTQFIAITYPVIAMNRLNGPPCINKVLPYLPYLYPHHHRSVVTTRRVLSCVGFSLAYFTGFTLLQFVGVSTITLLLVDLQLHATLVTILLITGSTMLLRSYRQYVKAYRRFESARSLENRDASSPQLTNRISERQFTVVNLLLAGILVVCTLPHIITVHILFYTKQQTQQERLDMFAAVTNADEMMFVKVALDAFIFAWTVRHYLSETSIFIRPL